MTTVKSFHESNDRMARERCTHSCGSTDCQLITGDAYLGQVVGRDEGQAVDAHLVNAVHSLKNSAHPLETLHTHIHTHTHSPSQTALSCHFVSQSCPL